MNYKTKALVQDYLQILHETDRDGISADGLFERLKPSIVLAIRGNEDSAARQLFKQIEERALGQSDSVLDDQSEFGFELNPEAPIALGDKTRILLKYCNRGHLEARRGLIVSNRDSVIAKADKEIAAIDNALNRMGPEDRLEDIL